MRLKLHLGCGSYNNSEITILSWPTASAVQSDVTRKEYHEKPSDSTGYTLPKRMHAAMPSKPELK